MIETTSSRNDYLGNDSVSEYDYEFRIDDKSHLRVWIKDDDGVPAILTVDVDYSVSGIGDAEGGSIELIDAAQDWISGSGNLKNLYTLHILRRVPKKQEFDIVNQGTFYPEGHEGQFDYKEMEIQDLQEQSDRSVKLHEAIKVADFDPTIPIDIATPSVLLMTNSDGDGFETIARSSLQGEQGEQGDPGPPGTDGITELTGEGSASGPGSANLILDNDSVIGKVLTGYSAGAGTVDATDSILEGIQKVDGNSTAAQADATQAIADAASAQSDADQALLDAAGAQTDIDNHIADTAGAHAASAISFNNVTSGLAATDVQAAIDEMVDGGLGGGGGPTLQWYGGDSNGPMRGVLANGVKYSAFAPNAENVLYVMFTLPTSYATGTPIYLRAGKAWCASTSGNFLFQAVSRLFDQDIDMTSTPTGHTSTNTQQAVDATTNQARTISDIDITEADGEINSVAAAAGKTILVELTRKTSSETSGVADDVYLAEDSFELVITEDP